ncbi:O-linked N-acetylglucosamine transferase, SPINDLY family protein [Oculatella sp. FACHB-28]|uniref:O-linked N-acetylglucosamine transferase, SPINDLY family protein n=1 Tax=Oculatella sp. FACHB-28 TaxID=2692845 RepID=UPI001684A16B|nr:O-linked N-acetylglucosamine transferase, SPINDLY family protein [Oculatella sp. FACHB-28]MBD2055510.1 O-linked N-acetylglucosamine transferase, SPINDLY family protein [Oculatella sp. FACHB-28]
MTVNTSSTNQNWQQLASKYWIQGDFSKAAKLYEQAIQQEPEVKAHYWNLGLLLVLQGEEAEAQTTWLVGMAEGEPEQMEEWTLELLEVLQAEAERQESLNTNSVAWAIRQHMREIAPQDPNNLFKIIQLAIKLETLSEQELLELEITQLLKSDSEIQVDTDILLKTIEALLNYPLFEPSLLDFIEACSHHTQKQKEFIDTLMLASVRIAYTENQPFFAIRLGEICLSLDSKNAEVLRAISPFYQNSNQYDKGIEVARQAYSLAEDLPSQIYSNFLVLRGLMTAGGYWDESLSAFQKQEELLLSLIQENPHSLDIVATLRLITPLFFQPYFRDNPRANRLIQNQVVRICQDNIQRHYLEAVEKYQQRSKDNAAENSGSKVLRIGYISHCLSRHSVGWLARWLFKHHNHSEFRVYTYLIGTSEVSFDPLQDWFIQHSDFVRKSAVDSAELAEQIYQDQIDILVDLDSITLDTTCAVMARKPAPIQATWLGWDASGLPAIDYFIADPYVLPESAEEYYSEKIWRLPRTYIAVDGFEANVPSLRRDELEIPGDAVVFFSGQKGHKRHRDTAKLQMRIIKEVPNSYFLIKGFADQDAIKNFFFQIAEEEGVERDRLRFLPDAVSEQTHRANLTIADVVLDTFPYNGATTTLETLWMGIPLITRVGEQFAARNSYTMLMNVGVTEGIAWTDEEYIEWGVRFGQDEALRQQVSWKLLRSRHTAPLWNAKQFARDMEDAYRQMWVNYTESK